MPSASATPITNTDRYPTIASKAALLTLMEQTAFMRGNNRDAHMQVLFQVSNTDTSGFSDATASVTGQPTSTPHFPVFASKAAFMTAYEQLIYQRGASRDLFLQLIYQLGNTTTSGWADPTARHDD